MSFRQIINLTSPVSLANQSSSDPLSRDETIYSKASYSADPLSPDDKVNFKKPEGVRMLYILYRRDPTSFRVINARTSLAMAPGFKLIPSSAEVKKATKDFLSSFHKTDPMGAAWNKIRNLAIDAGWSGQGWWEKLFDNGSLKNAMVGVTPIHPLTMDYKRDAADNIVFDNEGEYGKKGTFLAYHQKVEEKERDIDKRRVAHLKLHEIGDELLGISELEPPFKTIHRKMSIEDGIAQGSFRHGVPFLDLSVGDEMHPPTKPMMDQARDAVKNSSYMSEYVHPYWFSTNLHEQFSLAKSARILDPYIENMAGSSGLPLFLLRGTGDKINRVTAEALMKSIPPLVIEPIQQKLKLFLEEQIFSTLLESKGIEGSVTVQWNETFPHDSKIAEKLKILSEIRIGDKPLLSWTEAREMLKLPSPEPGIFSKEASAGGKERMSLAEMQAIYLVNPHARLIHEGHKKAIVKSRDFKSMVDKPLLLVSGKLAYGKIKLRKSKLISLDDFKDLRQKHRISEAEREKWWPKADTLFLYDFDVIEMFKKPLKVSIPQGVQTFVKGVKFSEEEVSSIDICSTATGHKEL